MFTYRKSANAKAGSLVRVLQSAGGLNSVVAVSASHFVNAMGHTVGLVTVHSTAELKNRWRHNEPIGFAPSVPRHSVTVQARDSMDDGGVRTGLEAVLEFLRGVNLCHIYAVRHAPGSPDWSVTVCTDTALTADLQFIFKALEGWFDRRSQLRLAA